MSEFPQDTILVALTVDPEGALEKPAAELLGGAGVIGSPVALVIAPSGSGDAAAAETSYRRALELDAGNAGALKGLGTLLGRLGRADEAAVMFERLTPEQQERDIQRREQREQLGPDDGVLKIVGEQVT